MNRRTVIRLALLVIPLVVVAAAWWASRAPGTTPIPIDWVDGTAARAELRVSLTFSSCTAIDHVDVAEDPRTVRVTVHVHDLQTCGTDPVERRVEEVRLDGPLGDRAVVDGSTGATLTRS
jgi:hypothetical protein